MAPEYTEGQCGLLDVMRPAERHRDGRGSRSVHSPADSARRGWLFWWRRQVGRSSSESCVQTTIHLAPRPRQAPVQSATSQLRRGGTAMPHRLLLSGIVAIGIAASTIASAAAQPFTGASAGSAVGQAEALAARIRGYHRWTGATPPPAGYWPTMRAGEAVMGELAGPAHRGGPHPQSRLARGGPRTGDPPSCQ